jgi:hypothetical protein
MDVCPRSLFIFVIQYFCLASIVLTAVINLGLKTGDKDLWLFMLSSCVGKLFCYFYYCNYIICCIYINDPYIHTAIICNGVYYRLYDALSPAETERSTPATTTIPVKAWKSIWNQYILTQSTLHRMLVQLNYTSG